MYGFNANNNNNNNSVPPPLAAFVPSSGFALLQPQQTPGLVTSLLPPGFALPQQYQPAGVVTNPLPPGFAPQLQQPSGIAPNLLSIGFPPPQPQQPTGVVSHFPPPGFAPLFGFAPPQPAQSAQTPVNFVYGLPPPPAQLLPPVFGFATLPPPQASQQGFGSYQLALPAPPTQPAPQSPPPMRVEAYHVALPPQPVNPVPAEQQQQQIDPSPNNVLVTSGSSSWAEQLLPDGTTCSEYLLREWRLEDNVPGITMTVYDTQTSFVTVEGGTIRPICNTIVYNQRFTRLHIAAWGGGHANIEEDRAKLLSQLRIGWTYRFCKLKVKPPKRSDVDVKFTFVYTLGSEVHLMRTGPIAAVFTANPFYHPPTSTELGETQEQQQQQQQTRPIGDRARPVVAIQPPNQQLAIMPPATQASATPQQQQQQQSAGTSSGHATLQQQMDQFLVQRAGTGGDVSASNLQQQLDQFLACPPQRRSSAATEQQQQQPAQVRQQTGGGVRRGTGRRNNGVANGGVAGDGNRQDSASRARRRRVNASRSRSPISGPPSTPVPSNSPVNTEPVPPTQRRQNRGGRPPARSSPVPSNSRGNTAPLPPPPRPISPPVRNRSPVRRRNTAEYEPPPTPEFTNHEIDENGVRLGIDSTLIDYVLPVIEIGAPHIKDANGEDNSCSICGGKYRLGSLTGTILPCDHFFHHQCAKKWLMTRKRCPFCNQNVS